MKFSLLPETACYIWRIAQAETYMALSIITHTHINRELCGTPRELTPGRAVVVLTTLDSMAVDEKGLVHGGFIFGLADHAAMLAVNHPNVVLAGADVRFNFPVRPNEELIAYATVIEEKGRKRTVHVEVKRNDETVFSGTFLCAVLDTHVLDKQ